MAGAQIEKCFVPKQEMHPLAENKEKINIKNKYKEKYDEELKDIEGTFQASLPPFCNNYS